VRRSPLFRAFAGFAAAWIVICLAEPAQLDTCSMHGGLAIDAGNPSAGSHTASAHGDHARQHSATHSGGAGANSHHNDPSDGRSKQCSCLGDCSSGISPLEIVVAAIRLEPQTIQTAAPVFSYDSPALVSVHFLLPFPNGPPAASSRA
jgi:hypothetical protein